MKYEHQKKFLIMKKTTIKTDFVKKMRDIREKLSLEIMDMTFEQEQEYIKNQLSELKLRKHGRKYRKTSDLIY